MKEIHEKILKAIEIGNLDQIHGFLKDGLNPNFRNNMGNSPLYISIATSQLKVAEMLLQNGAKVDYKNNERKETALYFYITTMAETKTHSDPTIEIPKLLLKYGANPNLKRTKTDLSLLHDAVIKQNFQLVELLLKNGANVEEHHNSLWVTPLCFPSNIAIVKLLITYNGNVDHIQKSGKPLLFEYLELNKDQDPDNLMKNLLLSKVKLDVPQVKERLVLLIQDRKNNNLMSILANYSDDLTLIDELLIYAVQWSNEKIMLELLKLEANPNYYFTQLDTTALFEAITYKDFKTASLLIQNGATYSKMPLELQNRIKNLRLNSKFKDLLDIENQ